MPKLVTALRTSDAIVETTSLDHAQNAAERVLYRHPNLYGRRDDPCGLNPRLVTD
jgi:hypothetical protein